MPRNSTPRITRRSKPYSAQKLRCNLCGGVFTTQTPEGVSETKKYDATVGSMIALLKYGTGMPFNREETLQAGLGVPLPASTQWDIVNAQAKRAEPVFEELIRQAAQGGGVHHDDTGVKILEVMGREHDKRLGPRRLPIPQGNIPLKAAVKVPPRVRRRSPKRSARARSPRGSWRSGKAGRSRYSSADASKAKGWRNVRKANSSQSLWNL